MVLVSISFTWVMNTAFGATKTAVKSGCEDVVTKSSHWLQEFLIQGGHKPNDTEVVSTLALVAEKNHEAFTRLAIFGHSFPLLALHPGLATRLERFEAFMHAHPGLREKGPAKALEAFRLELGEVHLWRALVLSDAGLESIREHGLIPNFIRTNQGSEVDLYRWILTTGIGPAVRAHLGHRGAAISPFASYSQQGDLARLAAKRAPDNPNLRYVLRSQIDVLDIVYLSMAGGLIEEAVALTFVPPDHIENLHSVQGEAYNLAIIDMLEDRHFIGRSYSDPWIPTLDQPRIVLPR